MRPPSIAKAQLRRRPNRVARPHRAPFVALIAALVVGAGGLAACSDESEPEPTAAGYASELEAICAGTAAQLDAVPDPPDGITITEFATQASSILTGEAEQVRQLDVPRDLAADHRALVANDEDQATAWTDLAEAVSSGGTDLSEITTLIASLNLGRNDLVTTMGAPACVRVPG